MPANVRACRAGDRIIILIPVHVLRGHDVRIPSMSKRGAPECFDGRGKGATLNGRAAKLLPASTRGWQSGKLLIGLEVFRL